MLIKVWIKVRYNSIVTANTSVVLIVYWPLGHSFYCYSRSWLIYRRVVIWRGNDWTSFIHGLIKRAKSYYGNFIISRSWSVKLVEFCKNSATWHMIRWVIRSLWAMNYNVDHLDVFLVHGIHNRLDPGTSKEWELHRASETLRIYELLDSFDRQAKALWGAKHADKKSANESQTRSEGFHRKNVM